MHEIVSFEKEINFKNLINNITSISLEHTLNIVDTSNIKGDFIVSGTYKMTAASQIENDFSYKIPVDIEIDKKYDLSNLIIDIDDFTYEVLNDSILKVNIMLLLDKLELKKEQKIDFLDDEMVRSKDLFMEEDTKEKLEFQKNDYDFFDNSNDNIELLETEDIINEIDKSINCMVEQTKESSNNIENKEDDFINTKEKINSEEIITEEVNKKEELSNIETTDSKDSPSLFESFDSSQETYSTYSVYILRENDSIEEIISKYKTTRDLIEEYNDLNDLKIGMKIIIPNTNNE